MIHSRSIAIAVLILLFFSLSSYSQSGLKKADKYFLDFNYKKAMKLYFDLESQGKSLYYVTYRIGDCYRHLGHAEKAVEWYLKAIGFEDVDKDTYYILSQELKKLGRYDEAEKYLKMYDNIMKAPGESFISENPIYLNQLIRDSLKFTIFPLKINSRFSDIGPILYKNQLVFCSNRNVVELIKRSDIRDGSNFYKIYSSKRNGFTNFSEPKLFDRNLNSKYNDGPIAFNDNKTIAFITRNIEAPGPQRNLLNIFVNRKHKGTWDKQSSVIPLAQTKGSYMHAFITKDDKGVYFVSDMEGGYGGLDIYYSEYKNGFLTHPVNLGPKVNSRNNEMFPFVDERGRLFYSSDKNEGLGGLDIYFCYPETDGFSQSFNMGYPINTSSDDFGMMILEDGMSGYFVSNRDGGVGKDDIYAFRQNNTFDYQKIQGIVVSNETQMPLKEAVVNVYEDSMLIASAKTNENGEFYFYCRKNSHLFCEVKQQFFQPYRQDISKVLDGKDDEFYLSIELNEY